jgi:hypothetical protein
MDDPKPQSFFERITGWIVRLTNELTFAPFLLNIEGSVFIAKKADELAQGSILGQIAVLISNIINLNFTENKESHWYDFIFNLYSKIVHFIQNIAWEGLKKILSLFGLNIDFSLEELQNFLVSIVVKGFVYYFTIPFGINLFFEALLSSRSFLLRASIAMLAFFLVSLPFIDLLSGSIMQYEIQEAYKINFATLKDLNNICDQQFKNENSFIITYLFDFIVSLTSFSLQTIEEKYQILTKRFACYHLKYHFSGFGNRDIYRDYIVIPKR